MEYQTSPDWSAVSLQWIFLFALIGTWFIPAFLFRNLARRHDRKAWPFFLIGVGFGAMVMFFTGYIMQGVQTIVGPRVALPYLILLFLILPVVAVFAAHRFLKRSFQR